MIRLKQLGHIALVVEDVDKARSFYRDILGIAIREEDPEHGGTFMGLEGFGHSVDLFARSELPEDRREQLGNQRVHHFAFQVETEDDLKEAYQSLVSSGVEVVRAVNHESQHSIYFYDPDGNRVEIYWEFPDAVDIFEKGRHDVDKPLAFAEEQSTPHE